MHDSCLLVQVSDKERDLEYGTLFRDVASVISEKCVNPENNRPYTLTMIERGLKELGFAVDPKKNAKQQALEALPQLQSKIPIRRARMRLKILVLFVSPFFSFPMAIVKLLLPALENVDSDQIETRWLLTWTDVARQDHWACLLNMFLLIKSS